MKILLLLIEFITIIATLIFVILWFKNPSGTYEPIYYSSASFLCSIIVDIARRKLTKNTNPLPDQSTTNSSSATNSPNAAVQNMVNSPNGTQIIADKVFLQRQKSKIKVEGEWNKIDLAQKIYPPLTTSIGLLFRNELETGYIKGIVKSDFEGMPGERRFDTNLHDLNPLNIYINSSYIYIKIEEVESMEHSLQIILAGVEFKR